MFVCSQVSNANTTWGENTNWAGVLLEGAAAMVSVIPIHSSHVVKPAVRAMQEIMRGSAISLFPGGLLAGAGQAAVLRSEQSAGHV